jgi:1,4-alpha-glucan branching enzyme
VPRFDYRVGVPKGGFYKEVLNSDSYEYGGSNMGNAGGVSSEDIPWHGRAYSLKITLPPLAVVVFKPVKDVVNK